MNEKEEYQIARIEALESQVRWAKEQIKSLQKAIDDLATGINRRRNHES